MYQCKVIIAILLLCFSPFTLSAGDPVLGKQKSVVCSQCHGADGNSPDQNIPKLAGQLESYIINATTEFREGIRKDPMMSNIITVIQNVQDLEDIAAYFALQPPMQGQQTNKQMAIEGEKLFTSERCNYCHGEGGKRFAPFKESIAPIIGGQHKAYLIKAMQDIGASKRPGDIYNLMPRLLGNLSNQQIEAIAEYLSGL
ncbi:MAG: cytochrome c4 [Gammaproteobacteria bacterium]|nr:cytochrome c4 [Gammaproteobacteria bacterium]